MATTLLGRHKDVFCQQCGYPYQVSASGEIDPRDNTRFDNDVVSGTCPMCRFTMDLAPDNPQGEKYPSFSGDRILVAKFPYQFADPDRWDVAVFRYPGGATTNYIKRVIGLPGETIRIRHGDIWVRGPNQERFSIARKPPAKIRAMLQPVYDNDYVLPKLIELGWPARWSAEAADGAAGAWATSDYRSFQTDGSGQGEAWIRYRHIVPTASDWELLQAGSAPSAESIRPQLVSDYSAYNAEKILPRYARDARRGREVPQDEFGLPLDPDHGFGASAWSTAPEPQNLGLHWVGDLAVECTMEVRRQEGAAVLELIQGGRAFRCTLDLKEGTATLSISGLDSFQPKPAKVIPKPGAYQLLLANVDHQLTLWVNGRPVAFDGSTAYEPLDNELPQPADLAPVGIAARGAALRVSRLKVLRDIYYIAQRLSRGSRMHGPITDFDYASFPYHPFSAQRVAEFLSAPSQWAEAFSQRRDCDFPLGPDQFLVLGDNSAESKDSRLWEGDGFEFYVKRDLLIGKALFIYWPHSWNEIPYLRIPFPLFPNFARMGFVR
jgi:signal peptidase I